ncbi:MAG TPA: ATP-binding cassette domain-containing protein [Bacteroidales bacterium]|nr:ATP-binding cassette domain-containing protein [Bacteroidales bacterium]
MSEQILKALMQLFAIIARPEAKQSDRRIIVESFLRRQLNEELVQEYLNIFDEYYRVQQDKTRDTDRHRSVISASSVKVLKITSKINEELTQVQKFIVLFQLFDFVRIDSEEISKQELEFIDTIADQFRISPEEYTEIKEFVQFDQNNIPDSENILIIDNRHDFYHPRIKHLLSESLVGQIRILHINSNNLFFLRYFGQNELYLNGQIVLPERVYMFTYGSSLRNQQIKPIYYSDVVGRYTDDKIKTKIYFEAKNIEYRFKNGKIGLHNISFSEESGRLVGIMGASGAGKSTLLNVLNGSTPPTQGEVLINGYNIYTQKDKVKGIIGFVSQDDLLIEDLTVYQNLYYNAKLCFDNLPNEEIERLVNQTLINLGLYEIKDIQVGTPLNKKISGGQRKRLNIALELIREPAVLFLDEPTSGLSSRDSENILDLLKELTLKGKLVFVVIHQPSSDIFKMFDRLLILDNGGYLIYNGDPIESIMYFKSKIHHANWNESECKVCGNVNPEQIFNIVETRVLNEYGQETLARKISPKEWAKFYEESFKQNNKPRIYSPELPPINFKIPGKIKQLIFFATRDILSKLSNTQYLIVTFLEAPILAFILAFIIKYFDIDATNQLGYYLYKNSNLPVYIFMSVIVAIFMGLTTSAEEIIKDRKILKREAFLNLSWTSYLFSKAFTLLIISAIQALTFVWIGNSIIEIKEMYFRYWLVLFSAWFSSNIMGLVISDSFKTVVTIYMLIPFLVIPQIILSGVMVKYEKLNPYISSPNSIPIYGELITARWAYEALAVEQFMNNRYTVLFYPYQKAMSIANYKKDYWAVSLRNKLDIVKHYYRKPEYHKEVEDALTLLRNEIALELSLNPKVKFIQLNNLYLDKIDDTVIEDVETYLDQINRYYVKLYNKANTKKDELINSMQQTPEGREKFLELKRKYANESLEEFVTNSNEVTRIIEYKGHLIQKIDPIYLDPLSPMIKAHFYAPQKMVFGVYYPTYWVNVVIIWVMTVLLFIALKYRLLLRFLNYLETLFEKLFRKEE